MNLRVCNVFVGSPGLKLKEIKNILGCKTLDFEAAYSFIEVYTQQSGLNYGKTSFSILQAS